MHITKMTVLLQW